MSPMPGPAIRFRLPASPHLIGACIVILGIALSFFLPDARHPDPALRPFAHFITTVVHTAGLILGAGTLLYLAWKDLCAALALRTIAVIGTETALFGILKEA